MVYLLGYFRIKLILGLLIYLFILFIYLFIDFFKLFINSFINSFIYLLGDSRNYMPPILVPSSDKLIKIQILVIAKLYRRKDFILKVLVCDIIRPS